MNFKTTIVLVALLAVAGLVVLFTRDRGAEENQETVRAQQRVFDIEPGDVSKLVVASADTKSLVLEKDGAAWRLREPVTAAAESFEVDSLLRAITGLESTSIVSKTTETGVDNPRYTVDITTTDNRNYTLLVGDKTAVGESLYVSRKDKNQTLVVGADLLEQLAKSASAYRDPKLVNMSTGEITQVTIEKPDGRLVLNRTGDDWRITEPAQMPAEKTDVDDILFGLTGLRATEVVAEDLSEASSYQLEPARFTATLSAAPTTLPAGIAAPTTAPATAPAPVTIKLGGYDDVRKRNILATSSQNPVIAKVGATIIETIDKTPLELRDRKVLDIDRDAVSSITITTDLAATTQPTTREASKSTVSLKRRHEAVALGPAAAKAQATTAPAVQTEAATQAVTQPAAEPATQAATKPLSKWEVAVGEELKDADDSRVDSLLSQLDPLRVQKYLETAPATQPTATYVVTITTQAAGGAPAATHELRLVDPGDSKPLIGTYNGLAFEVDRFMADRFSGDFVKSATDAEDHDQHDGHDDEAPAGAFGQPFSPQ